MIRLGITGGIGSGKSTVTELLKIQGIPVYIADIESKKLTESSPIIKDKLQSYFGKELYKEGKLDKQLFASIIFKDPDKLALANSIIHPEVYKHYFDWLRIHSNSHLIVLESAILYESGMIEYVDKTLLVYTVIEERIKRVMLRDGINRELVESRMNNQMSEEEKAKRSDYIIDNNEKISVIAQISHLLKELE